MGWAERAIAEAVWVCIDVETTGLEVERGHRVCEIAAVRGALGGETEELSSLANPARPIPENASRVSGLSDADLAEAPPFAQIAAALYEFLADAVIVAHNAPFDFGFVETELGRCSLHIPAAPVVDTTIIAQSVLRLPARNLEAVAGALGLANPPTHRALDDARATCEVLRVGLAALEKRGARTVGDVIEALMPIPNPQLLPGPSAAIREALKAGADLHMTYQGSRGPSERTVRPLRLELRRSRLTLNAFCRRQGAPRDFRVDRIVSAGPVA